MLVIFDIDGTLCDTHDVDARCFADAIREITGHSLATVDWSRYPEVTSAAIVRDFLADHGVENTEETERRILCQFVSRLESEALLDPKSFHPVGGAVDIFNELRTHASYKIAIATGCWTQSAQTKLRRAGFDISGVPFASSSDTPHRSDIISLAAKRAGVALKDAIYVGDGSWDLKATRELGIPFIGIGSRVDILRDLGAPFVFPSFQEREAFISVLDKVPA